MAMGIDAYEVNWPGLGNRHHRAAGYGEEPKMTVSCFHKCLDGGALPRHGEQRKVPVGGGRLCASVLKMMSSILAPSRLRMLWNIQMEGSGWQSDM